MADTWDGGTATTGIIKWEFNTDKSAIRFSLTNNAPWPPTLPTTLTANLVEILKGLIESLETLANRLDRVDSGFATTCRNTAAGYRIAAGL